jgi:hypothetical protein
MRIFIVLVALCGFASVLPASAQELPAGTTVNFDRCTSSNPALGCWDRGVITGSTKVAGQTHYKIRNQSGTPYTIPDDPRWIRSVDPSARPVPDGTHTGPYPASVRAPTGPTGTPPTAPGQAEAKARPGQQNTAERFPAGTRVEFDRVEAQNPANGRWDEGVVVGRTPGGYIQIRGNNGILYRVSDDPRWILPAGTPLPGPRHDYQAQQNPGAAPGPGKGTTGPVPAGGGGPLAGEWAVVQMDGKPTGGYGMTWNFVGSRWEQIFQGSAVSGQFSVSGNTVRMVQDDGVEFGTFQYSVQGNQLSLKGVGKAAGSTFVFQRAHK